MIAKTLGAMAGVMAIVSIPLWVGPGIAQKILDETVISLPNSTLSVCMGPHAWVQNIAKINVPFSLPSFTLLSYTQVLSTTMCDSHTAGWHCDNPNVTKIGSYVSPDLHLSRGESIQTFDSRLDAADTGYIMLNGVVLPLFLEDHRIHLILSAEDVTISVLGIRMKGLKMHKELTCKKEKILDDFHPLPIPNKVCYPNQPSHAKDFSAGYYMSCVSGALPIGDKTTTSEPMTSKIGASIIF